MKTKGSATYLGITLEELNKVLDKRAIIPVSRKFIEAYKMISGPAFKLEPNNQLQMPLTKGGER